jgi:hypothetical protein
MADPMLLDDELASEILRRADELLAAWSGCGAVELETRLLVLIHALAELERNAKAALAAAGELHA